MPCFGSLIADRGRTIVVEVAPDPDGCVDDNHLNPTLAFQYCWNFVTVGAFTSAGIPSRHADWT